MFPVVVSDLDGTLLNPDHRFSLRTRQVMQSLNQQGVQFILATGRHYEDIKHLPETVGFDMYLVTSNGARAHSPNHQTVFQKNICPDMIKPLLALRHDIQVPTLTNVYQNSEWLIDTDARWLRDFHADSGFYYRVVDLNRISEKNIQKITFISDSVIDLQPLYQKVKALFGDRLSLTSSSARCFEIMSAGVTKASTLKEVLKLKGYELKDAIAFGDGLNDLQMLSEVGKGVVMGNADARLVNLLPDHERIGFSRDDAVAHYLEQQYAS